MADNQQQNDTELDAAVRRSEAARRKRLAAAYRANTQAARDIGQDWQDYDNSVANDWFGLDQGGNAANAVNIAAKGASAFSRMAGEGLNFGDSIEDSWEEQTDFSQDQLDAYNRLKAERHRRERLAELEGVEGDADADMERVALQTAGDRMKKGDLDKLNQGAKKGERKGVDDFDLSGDKAQSNSLWQEAWERTGPGWAYETAKSLIPDQPKAAAERMADLERRREERAEIKDTFDLSGMVYEGNTNRAMNNLTDSVSDEVDGLQAGWAKLTDGETKEGILDLASAVAGIGAESLNLALDDPQAVAEFFADSAPGIMMAGAGKIPNAMQGLGYGMSIYRDGVNRMREEEGRMPTESEAQTMAMKAVAIGLLDSVGDANVGRALRGGRAGALTRGDTARKAVLKRQQGELKSAKKAAKKSDQPAMSDPAVQDAQKRIRTTANRLRSSARSQQKGVVASTAGAAGSLGKTMGIEGGTEGVQTKLEGDVTGQEASLNDMVKAAVVGGAVGGAARASNFNPGPAIAKSLSGRAAAKNQKTADALNDGLVESQHGSIEEQTRKAEQSGEVGDLLNPETTAYSPESAAASMAKRLNNPDGNLSTEQRDEARRTLDDAASRAEESWQQLAWKQQITEPGGVKEANEALKGARTDLKEAERAVKQATDPQAKKVAEVRASIARNEVKDLEADVEVAKRGLSAEERKSLAEQVGKAKERAKTALQYKKSVADNEAKANPDTLIQSLSRPAAETGNDTAKTSRDGDSLIRLAMSDPASLSASAIERLVNDVENSLTDPQRESLRRFTKAQATEHAKKKTQRVRNDIINGSGGGKGDKAYRGMAQYRETVANGLASGNTRLVNNQLSLLRNFRTSHSSKAAALQEAMKQVRGTNESRTVQRTEDGLEWEVSTDRVSKSQRGTEGSLVVKDSPQSQSLVTRVGNEAEYIDNTYGQLRSAADSHFASDDYVRTDVSTDANTEAQAGTETETQAETGTESQTTEPVTEEVTEQAEEATQETEQTQESNDTTETGTVPEESTEAAETTETEERTEEDDGELFDLDSLTSETGTEAQATREADTNAEIDALLNSAAEAETTTTEETQGEVDQAVQEMEQTQEEQASNSESVTRYTGEKGHLMALTPRGPQITAENILSAEVNLASQTFRQIESTRRPFVAAKNFARQAYNDPSLFQQFIKEKLTAEQTAFLQNVMAEANLLARHIEDRMPASLTTARSYQHQDMYKSLLGKNNAVEENLTHAIATAGLAWITESDINMAYNTKDDVNRLMHRDKDAGVSRELMDLVGSAGTRRNAVVEQIGQRAVRLLGFKTDEGAFSNLEQNMAMSLGARAVQALEDAGYVQLKNVPTHDLYKAMGEEVPESISKKSVTSFLRITTKGSAGRDKVNGLVSASRASDNVLQRLLADEANSTRPPSSRQIKFTQVKVKNGTTDVPRSLKSIMGQKTKEANYIREEKLSLLESMDAVNPDAMAEIGGAAPQGYVRQANLRDSGENRDRDIRRGLQSFKDYVAGAKNLPHGIKTPIFFDQEVWSVQRVGVKSSLINPQSNTGHRFMVKMPSWDTEVSTSRNGDMHGDYLLGVAEALGVKTEKAEREDNIAAALEKLADPVIDAGVEAIRKQIRGEELTVEDTNAIVAASNAGGEKYHSLDGLHAAAAMAEAQSRGDESVTLTLPREVDGKTNGPMMALMQLGMDKARMAQMMARGGFYTQASGEQGYHTWGAKEGSADIYEAVATTLRSTIMDSVNATVQDSSTPEATRRDMTVGLQNIATFTGPMVDQQTGKVKGRNFVKTPITAMSFGSSLNTVVKNMADEFVENSLKKIEELYNDSTKTAQAKEEEFQRLFTALNGLTGIKTKSGKINRSAQMKPVSLEQFMAQGISEQTDEAIRRNFGKLMGDPIKSAMKHHFSEFLDRKTFIDSGAEAAFGLFSSLYDFEVQRFRKELADKGELPTTKKGNPVMDLTTEQHNALMERLKDVTPMVHTAWSLKDGDLSAGQMMAKNGRADMTGDLAYRTRAAFTRVDGGDGNKTWDLYPTVRRFEAPGARTLPTLTHAQDSYTASSSYAKVPSLNVHDALVTGLKHLGDAATELNRNMFESMVDYSMPREVANTVERTVDGFSRYMNQYFPDGLPPELADRIGGALGQAQERFEKSRGEPLTADQDVLTAIVTGLRDMATTAEKDKLSFLSELAVVAQYPSEGSNYEVDDAGRARAKDRLEELNTQPQTIVTGEQTKALFETIANTRAGLEPKPIAETEPSTPTGEDTEVREETETEPKAKGPSRAEQAGTRGSGNVVERTPLSDAIAGDQIKTGAQLADLAMQSLGNRATDKGMALILGRVRKMIPKDLKVSIVTPDNVTTRINEDGFHPEASAMFMSSGKAGDAGTIYIKGEGFAEASPTAEMAVHELIHAVTARKIQAARKRLSRDKKAKSKVITAVRDLEGLRREMVDHLKANNPKALQKHGPALISVDEMVSWGLTNADFQQLLRNFKTQGSAATKQGLLMSGMKRLLDQVRTVFFGEKAATRGETSAFDSVLSNSMVLLQENRKARDDVDEVKLYQQQAVRDMTTTQVFDVLGTAADSDAAFNDHLRDLVYHIEDKLQGPLGAFRQQAKKAEAATPVETFIKSVQTGQVPFVSDAISSGFPLTDRQSLVLEQVELAMREAASSHHATYRELAKVFTEARNRLTDADFHDGDWASATPTEKAQAKAKRDYLFKLQGNDKNGRSNHLARFVAMAMAQPDVNKLMRFQTDSVERLNGNNSLSDRIANAVERAMQFIAGRLTKGYAGQRADQRLQSLMGNLVDSEARHRQNRKRSEDSRASQAEELVGDAWREVFQQISGLASGKRLNNLSHGATRLAGELVNAVSTDRVEEFMDGVRGVLNMSRNQRQGMIASALSEMVGSLNEGRARAEQQLRRVAVVNEQARRRLKEATQTNVESLFQDYANIPQKDRDTLTKVALRTDMAALLGDFDMAGLESLVRSNEDLDAEIGRYRNQVAKLAPRNQGVLRQANDLGYLMVHGIARNPVQAMNAAAIVQQHVGDVEQHPQTVDAVNKLASLYALRYSGGRDTMARIMSEQAQRGADNALQHILKMHQQLQQHSQKSNTSADRWNQIKGESAEITDPHMSVMEVDQKDVEKMEKRGFKKLADTPMSPEDSERGPRVLMAVRDGGRERVVTGNISYTGTGIQGTTLEEGYASDATLAQKAAYNRKLEWAGRYVKDGVDSLVDYPTGHSPETSKESHRVPTLDQSFQPVSFRLSMPAEVSDVALRRDNDLSHVLGTYASRAADKEQSLDQNRQAIDLMASEYEAASEEQRQNFVEVSEKAQDKGLRESFNMLPPDAKAYAKEKFGNQPIMVRKDLADVMFGYRKASLVNMLHKSKDERNAAEALMADFLGSVLGDKAAVRVRRAEDMWQTVVTEAKDALVIKNLATLVGNAVSNLSVLYLNRVPMRQAIRDHREAFSGLREYRQMQAEWDRLTQLDGLGLEYSEGRQVSQRLKELDDAMNRNPVKRLIDEGLLPTIVEDVDQMDDRFSYKNELATRASRWTAKMPPMMRSAGRTLYMTHDTPLYKAFNQGTQMSDFLARYTLYNHMTTRRKNPVGHDEAIQRASDMFVNYDVPTSRGLQYLNDVGAVMFTKYFLRIQRSLFQIFREQPARTLSLMAAESMLGNAPTVMDSTLLSKLTGGGPLMADGALGWFQSLDDIFTVNMALRPFN